MAAVFLLVQPAHMELKGLGVTVCSCTGSPRGQAAGAEVAVHCSSPEILVPAVNQQEGAANEPARSGITQSIPKAHVSDNALFTPKLPLMSRTWRQSLLQGQNKTTT